MRSVTVRLEDLRTMILNLGFVGENEHRTFRFDCKRMFGEYPSASVSLAVQPPAGGCYPATVERDGDLVSWTVTDSDLIEAGNGELQLTFMVGDVKAKTCIGRTKVERSLPAPGRIPTPIENWIEQAEEVISEAEAATAAAEDAAEHQPIIDDNGYWAVWDADAEEYVATEYKAQGTDGHDGVGIVSIEKTGTSGLVDTYTITFTSGDPVTYTVTNGRDADPAELIDDEAGAGDTDKVWSADKSSSLLTEINSKADKTVTDALQIGKAPVIIDSAEGNPIVLMDGANGLPIEGMKIHFLPKQDTSGGDPSPSHVCSISGWSGVTAWRTGQNLIQNKYYQYNSGQLWIGTESNNPEYYLFLKAGTYTLSASLKQSARFLVREEHDSANTDVGSSSETPSGSFTIAKDGKYKVWLYASGGITASNVDWVQLEVGSTASPYAEYTGASYPITFPAGETIYGGTFDAVNGVLRVEWECEQITYSYLSGLNSNYIGFASGIVQIGGNAVWIRNWNYSKAKARVSGGIGALCNMFPVSMHDTQVFSSQYRTYFGINSLESVQDFLSAVQTAENNGNGLFVAYPLATPIEIPIDPITVQTLIGDNTIWSDANGTIELDYRADTGLFVGGYYKKPETGIPASDLASGVIPSVPVTDIKRAGVSIVNNGSADVAPVVDVTGSTPSITGVDGTRYICGECATLSITAPASGCIDVIFESGSTPTVLTVTSAKTGVTAIKWANGFDPTALEENTTYEINILDGEFGVVGSWM